MVTLEKAATRLGVTLDRLVQQLGERRIAVVGKGKRARITEADIEQLAKPAPRVASPPPELDERILAFLRDRSAVLHSILGRPTGNVVPFIPRPKGPPKR